VKVLPPDGRPSATAAAGGAVVPLSRACWMAPEDLATGAAHASSVPADMYMMGGLMFEVLTGMTPFYWCVWGVGCATRRCDGVGQ
jgi:hypothetical protein